MLFVGHNFYMESCMHCFSCRPSWWHVLANAIPATVWCSTAVQIHRCRLGGDVHDGPQTYSRAGPWVFQGIHSDHLMTLLISDVPDSRFLLSDRSRIVEREAGPEPDMRPDSKKSTIRYITTAAGEWRREIGDGRKMSAFCASHNLLHDNMYRNLWPDPIRPCLFDMVCQIAKHTSHNKE